MVFYQEHGYPQGLGVMSTGGAKHLNDDYPSVYYLGGCDIASPEFNDNVSYALLRSNGVAVYGGTRSVTACWQPHWLKDSTYYSHLYFGKSTGEAIWTKRALEVQNNGRIGGTNFLINLLGDPSVVPMPQFHGETLDISPGFDVRLELAQQTGPIVPLDYEVRNNSRKKKIITIKASKYLKFSETKFVLRPFQEKALKLKIVNEDKMPLGTHKLQFVVKAIEQGKKKGITKTQAVTLEIVPRGVIYANSFDEALTYVGEKNKPLVLSPSEAQTDGVIGNAAVINGHRSRFNMPYHHNTGDFTVAFSFKLMENSASRLSIIDLETMEFYLENNQIKVNMRPNRWSIIQEGHVQVSGPTIQPNKWQNIIMVYNRQTNIIKLYVGSEMKEQKVKYTHLSDFPLRNINFHANGPKFAIDNLKIFNYELTDAEKKIVHSPNFLVPNVAVDDVRVHPDHIELNWYNLSGKKALVQVAADINFKKVLFTRKAINSVKLSPLPSGKKYYWRVFHYGKKGSVKSSMINSFTVDKSYKPVLFTVGKIAMPDAKVGVAGYNKILFGYILGQDHETKRRFKYKKLSGPGWLRISEGGRLFTNYGATADDIGINKFKVRFIAPDGYSQVAEFSIKVTN